MVVVVGGGGGSSASGGGLSCTDADAAGGGVDPEPLLLGLVVVVAGGVVDSRCCTRPWWPSVGVVLAACSCGSIDDARTRSATKTTKAAAVRRRSDDVHDGAMATGEVRACPSSCLAAGKARWAWAPVGLLRACRSVCWLGVLAMYMEHLQGWMWATLHHSIYCIYRGVVCPAPVSVCVCSAGREAGSPQAFPGRQDSLNARGKPSTVQYSTVQHAEPRLVALLWSLHYIIILLLCHWRGQTAL